MNNHLCYLEGMDDYDAHNLSNEKLFSARYMKVDCYEAVRYEAVGSSDKQLSLQLQYAEQMEGLICHTLGCNNTEELSLKIAKPDVKETQMR